MYIVIYNFSNAFGSTSIIWVIRTSFKRSLSEDASIKGFSLMLLFFFEPIITQMVDMHFEKTFKCKEPAQEELRFEDGNTKLIGIDCVKIWLFILFGAN